MALTKKQLKEIEETIRKRFLGLTHEALGEKGFDRIRNRDSQGSRTFKAFGASHGRRIIYTW